MILTTVSANGIAVSYDYLTTNEETKVQLYNLFSKYKIEAYPSFSFFEKSQKLKPADFVIASSYFDAEVLGYKKYAQFQINESDICNYTLLTINPKWNINNIQDGKIGLVDFVGRKKIKPFLENILGTKFKRIKRVTKPELLYPMLAMQSVDMILIRTAYIKKIQEKYKLPTFEITICKKISYPSIYVKENLKVNAKDFQLSREQLQKIGFTSLRVTNHK